MEKSWLFLISARLFIEINTLSDGLLFLPQYAIVFD